jgi:hypothetical protein
MATESNFDDCWVRVNRPKKYAVKVLYKGTTKEDREKEREVLFRKVHNVTNILHHEAFLDTNSPYAIFSIEGERSHNALSEKIPDYIFEKEKQLEPNTKTAIKISTFFYLLR